MAIRKKDFCIISFASGEPYLTESIALKKLCETSNLPFKLYDLEWLKSTNFYKENKELVNSKKCGYCSWKPYIILDALKYYKKILYLDSSMLFNPPHINEFIESSNFLSSTVTSLKNKFYAKFETFQIMNCLSEKYLEAYQVWAGVILVTSKAEKFLKEWLYYCKIKNCISDEFDKKLNAELEYHLYDQAIYSILYEKYNIKKVSNTTNKYAFFADTREPSHRKSIEKIFGKDVMKRQDNLIFEFAREYITNGSCLYNPLPIET